MVAAEVEAVLGQCPDLTVVKLADGAKDNWTFLTRALPAGVELIDLYHAAEQLKGAFDAAHGADSPKAAAQFEKFRHLLRHEPDGVERVIRALVYLRSKHPTTGRIAQVPGYFRRMTPRCATPCSASSLAASRRVARVTFTAPADGTCCVSASGDRDESGSCTVSVHDYAPPDVRSPVPLLRPAFDLGRPGPLALASRSSARSRVKSSSGMTSGTDA